MPAIPLCLRVATCILEGPMTEVTPAVRKDCYEAFKVAYEPALFDARRNSGSSLAYMAQSTRLSLKIFQVKTALEREVAEQDQQTTGKQQSSATGDEQD